MAEVVQFYGTGRRKTSVARVFLRVGQGRITVNRRPFEDYFPRETLRLIVTQPLELTGTTSQLDAKVNVKGGGLSGQAGAVRHGIARALAGVQYRAQDPAQAGGDADARPRMKERKKYGQPGARKRFQFSKR